MPPKKPREPRRHHVVPRFYLNRFSNGRQLRMVSRDREKSVSVTPAAAAVRSHFYTVMTRPGASPSVIEDLLSKVEGRAAPVLARLEHGIFPKGEERIWTSFFLALQMVRDPASRQAMEDFMTAAAQVVAKLATPETVRTVFRQQNGHEPTESRVEETLKACRKYGHLVRMNVPPEHHILTMLEVAHSMIPHLCTRPWRVVRYPSRLLLTSDMPVALHAEAAGTLPGQGVGVATADAIFFPLDPMHLLVLGRPGDDDLDSSVLEGEGNGAAEVNRLVAFSAAEWIFHHPEHNPLEGITIPPRPTRVRTIPARDGSGGFYVTFSRAFRYPDELQGAEGER